ncbi:MAG: nuclear transport factor 2 family protein [Thermoleophilaceae bacterium]
MSQENVEIVRRFYAQDEARMRDCAPWLHPDLEIIPSADFPEQAVLHGFEGFMQWVTRWPGMVEGYELTPERFWARGPLVVVALRERGAAGRSGVPIDNRYGNIWTLLDGLVVRIQVFSSLQEALEAAGLQE